MNFRPGVSFLPMLQKPVNLPCLATGFRRGWSIWVVGASGSRFRNNNRDALHGKSELLSMRSFVRIDDIVDIWPKRVVMLKCWACTQCFFGTQGSDWLLGLFKHHFGGSKIGCFEPQPTAVNWWLTCRSGLGTHPHHCQLWINIGYLNQIFFWYHLLYMYTPYIWVNVHISPFAVYFMSFWRRFSRSPYHLCSFFSLHILRFTEGIDVLLWTAMQTCNNDDNDT